MKRALMAATALILTTGIASAAPGYGHKGPQHNKGWSQGYSKVTPRERAAIANARANLAAVKARAWRDGRLSSIEKFQIRSAETRLQRAILSARFS